MKFKPISSKGIKRYSIRDRKGKVFVSDFAFPVVKGSSVRDFLEGLPGILGARDLKEVASAVVKAHKAGRTVAVGMGA
ncbi:MAG: hypothetical protein HY887_05380, partial [Deltaproteobacteria bacterium]|nr:hypothetical protein [Deltaproteobacteria bacterium]